MEYTHPDDFMPLKSWFQLYGTAVFDSPKLLHYHTYPIQAELIETGGMAKVGARIFLHKTRFWPEYQRIMLEKTKGGLPKSGNQPDSETALQAA